MITTTSTICLASALAVTSPIGIAAQPTLAVGREARYVTKMVQTCRESTQGSYTNSAKRRILEALGLLTIEEPVVNPGSVARANKFVNAMPEAIKVPDVGIDPEGDVSLEWDWTASRYCILSFDRDGKRIYGVVRDGESRGTFSTTDMMDALIKAGNYFNG